MRKTKRTIYKTGKNANKLHDKILSKYPELKGELVTIDDQLSYINPKITIHHKNGKIIIDIPKEFDEIKIRNIVEEEEKKPTRIQIIRDVLRI